MEDQGPIIGYWKIRGRGEILKLIMEFGKKPYQMEYYVQGPGPQFSKKDWFDKKFTLGFDFPNLPYLKDGDLKISESMSIISYLTSKYVPELMGKTQAEKAKISESLCVLAEIKNQITRACYTPDKSKIPEAFETVAPKVKQVQQKLGENEWLVGDSASVSDLFLMEITDQFQMMTEGTWLKDHTTLEAHNTLIKEIPNIKEYKSSPRFFEGPFNNAFASTNNLPADYWK